MGQPMTKDGQVTLPPHVRERLGLRAGDHVEFASNDQGEVILRSAPTRRAADATEAVARWTGAFPDGPGVDVLLSASRGSDWRSALPDPEAT
jgi:AbrB family looped-hinge helix DNA binding protein